MEKGKAVILVSVPARFPRVSMLFGFMDRVSFEVFPRDLAAGRREIWSGRICLFLRPFPRLCNRMQHALPHVRLQVQRDHKVNRRARGTFT